MVRSHSAVLRLSAQIEEQVKLLQKGVTHIGVGTPGRISALIEKGRTRAFLLLDLEVFEALFPCDTTCSCPEGLNLRALRYVVLDWNWRDQKLRRMADIPEVS